MVTEIIFLYLKAFFEIPKIDQVIKGQKMATLIYAASYFHLPPKQVYYSLYSNAL